MRMVVPVGCDGGNSGLGGWWAWDWSGWVGVVEVVHSDMRVLCIRWSRHDVSVSSGYFWLPLLFPLGFPWSLRVYLACMAGQRNTSMAFWV